MPDARRLLVALGLMATRASAAPIAPSTASHPQNRTALKVFSDAVNSSNVLTSGKLEPLLGKAKVQFVDSGGRCLGVAPASFPDAPPGRGLYMHQDTGGTFCNTYGTWQQYCPTRLLEKSSLLCSFEARGQNEGFMLRFHGTGNYANLCVAHVPERGGGAHYPLDCGGGLDTHCHGYVYLAPCDSEIEFLILFNDMPRLDDEKGPKALSQAIHQPCECCCAHEIPCHTMSYHVTPREYSPRVRPWGGGHVSCAADTACIRRTPPRRIVALLCMPLVLPWRCTCLLAL